MVDGRVSTVLAIRKALAKSGIEFLAVDEKGEGFRLGNPKAWLEIELGAWFMRNCRACFAFITWVCLFVSFQALAEEHSSCPERAAPLSALLMPPPGQESAETKAELQELLQLQKSRTSNQAKHARDDHQKTIGRFLAETSIQFQYLPAIANDLFDCIANSTEKAVGESKATFMRTRPYRLPRNKLHILKKLGDSDTFSYPSEHAAYGMAIGLVLAEMLPEKKEEIFRRIQDYGYSRLMSGTHFRSDVYTGEIAGAVIAASLFRSEAFRDEFEKVKSELRKAAGIAP